MNINWVNLDEIFAWVARASLYAVAVIAIIVLVQTLMRRALSAKWSCALWIVLLLRLAIPAGPESGWSLWNLAPQRWMHRILSGSGVPANQARSREHKPASVHAISDDIAAFAPSTAETAAAPENMVQEIPREPAISPDKSLSLWFAPRTLLPAIWLAGALSLMCGIVIGSLRLWNTVRRLPLAADPALLELLEECRRSMRVRTTIGLIVTDRVKSPILFGFIRPRILLPADLVRELPFGRMRYILLHELAHLKRRDIPTGWILVFLQSLHWFNPLVWWAFGRMRFDRELACDEQVLSRVPEDERRHYGDVLIGMLERFNHIYYLPAIAGILENKDQLKRRLVMIKKFRRPTRVAGIFAIILVVVLSGGILTEANSGAIEVERTLNEMIGFLSQEDLERWSEYYVRDDTFSAVEFGGTAISGFENFKTYMEDFLKGDREWREVRSFTNIETHVSGDTAWATVTDSVASADGRSFHNNRGIGTFGLVKRNNRWLINHYHMSLINNYPRLEASTAYKVIAGEGDDFHASDRYAFRVSSTSTKPVEQVNIRTVSSVTREDISSAAYNNNYFSLMPGESKSITVDVNPEHLKGEQPLFLVSGKDAIAGRAFVDAGSILCSHNGLRYSLGAIVQSEKGPIRCRPDGKWTKAEDWELGKAPRPDSGEDEQRTGDAAGGNPGASGNARKISGSYVRFSYNQNPGISGDTGVSPGVSGDLQKPVVLFHTIPAYTQEARDARIQGSIFLEVTVRKDGTVSDIKVTQGLGYGLDEASIHVIATQWRFRPGTRDGVPVDFPKTTIEVEFRLM